MNYECMYFLSKTDDRVERAYILWIFVSLDIAFWKKLRPHKFASSFSSEFQANQILIYGRQIVIGFVVI